MVISHSLEFMSVSTWHKITAHNTQFSGHKINMKMSIERAKACIIIHFCAAHTYDLYVSNKGFSVTKVWLNPLFKFLSCISKQYIIFSCVLMKGTSSEPVPGLSQILKYKFQLYYLCSWVHHISSTTFLWTPIILGHIFKFLGLTFESQPCMLRL